MSEKLTSSTHTLLSRLHVQNERSCCRSCKYRSFFFPTVTKGTIILTTLLATHCNRQELELGPGTNELSLRVGLHSGPVTAGVLRGDRARFQLFGDTGPLRMMVSRLVAVALDDLSLFRFWIFPLVNTASRMESTGVKGRIQMSSDTAEQLIIHGKQEWLQVREDRVHAKGKGDLETFFLKASGSDSKTSGTMDSTEFSFNNASTSHAALDQMESLSSEKVSSLIRWNVEMLTRFLKEIVASRSDQTLEMSPSFDQLDMPQGIPLDEVVEVIEFPDSSLPPETTKLSTIALPPRAKRQLHDFVRNVAALYKSKNAFHNFGEFLSCHGHLGTCATTCLFLTNCFADM